MLNPTSTVAFPRCIDSDSYYTSDCGSPTGAYILFISWNILSMYVGRTPRLTPRYIFVNMFTGVVVESFSYVYQRPDGASLNREEMRACRL